MKIIHVIIGIMLALMLCITPVAALTGDDLKVDLCDDNKPVTYTYSNLNNPDEIYFKLYTDGTYWMQSRVTFQAANISDAPLMVVNTYRKSAYIRLPQSVDEWEIKYYSHYECMPYLDDKYLKNWGIVNLNKKFGKYIERELVLVLHIDQKICLKGSPNPRCYIPSVD